MASLTALLNKTKKKSEKIQTTRRKAVVATADRPYDTEDNKPSSASKTKKNKKSGAIVIKSSSKLKPAASKKVDERFPVEIVNAGHSSKHEDKTNEVNSTSDTALDKQQSPFDTTLPLSQTEAYTKNKDMSWGIEEQSRGESVEASPTDVDGSSVSALKEEDAPVQIDSGTNKLSTISSQETKKGTAQAVDSQFNPGDVAPYIDDLSTQERAVYDLLVKIAHDETKVATFNVEKISLKLGIGKASVKTCLRRMGASGAIKLVDSKPGRKSISKYIVYDLPDDPLNLI